MTALLHSQTPMDQTYSHVPTASANGTFGFLLTGAERRPYLSNKKNLKVDRLLIHANLEPFPYQNKL